MVWHTGAILTENLPPQLKRFRLDRIDPIRIAILVALFLAALVVWNLARSRIVAPVDGAVTEQACDDYGEEIGRELVSYERSNRFGWSNRSEGLCSYGEGPDGEAPVIATIADIEPGLFYRATKWIGIIVQLGIVSLFLRVTVDPALDLYRYLRSWSA